jgi:hypothetical protein
VGGDLGTLGDFSLPTGAEVGFLVFGFLELWLYFGVSNGLCSMTITRELTLLCLVKLPDIYYLRSNKLFYRT